MPAGPFGPFQIYNFGRKYLFYVTKRFNYAPKFARQGFWAPIFARLKKRLGTAGLDY
jgi:hypothetical protein